jgi:hypothetical protein
MKRFASISVVSFALIALFAGAALAANHDFEDESGYQNQAAAFKALLSNDNGPATDYALQNSVDVTLDRAFSEVHITPNECTAHEKVAFLATLARTNVITDELGFE